jgi:hypothetical protein
MSKMICYYHVRTATDTPCYLTKEALAKAKRTWLCKGCSAPKPRSTAIHATLLAPPSQQPLNFVSGAGLPIASTAFLDALGAELVQDHLCIGRVYGPEGKKLSGWTTFRGKHRLIVRGSMHVSHRPCPDCGRDVYVAMGANYLYPAPPSGVAVFESHLWGIVLTEEIFERSGIGQWPGVYTDKLRVADAPDDSLGELFYP